MLRLCDESSMFQIRDYREGDEKEMVELFNESYKDYAGFVPRSPEFWLWCCKNRPGVRNDGIILADAGGHVIGYTVISDSGQILELCYKPKQNGEEVVSKLLETVESRLRSLGATSMVLNAPADDPIIRRACLELGCFESSSPHVFQLSIVNLAEFLRSILLSRLEKMKDHFDGEILLKVMQSSAPNHYDYVTLKFLDNVLFVERSRSESPRFTIETDKRTLVNCLLGGASLTKNILTRKIKVSPFWKIPRAIGFFSPLKSDEQWYVPLGDYG